MGWVENHPWKMGIVASVIVSFLAFFVFIKHNPSMNLDKFILWLPVVWFMTFLPVIIFESMNWLKNK